jgi:hypothetical protein
MAIDNSTVAFWLTGLPLYKTVVIGQELSQAISAIYQLDEPFDAFCPSCAKESTFNSVNAKLENTILMKEVRCSRKEHRLIVFFSVDNQTLVKIGQTPSLADIATAETILFKSVLAKNQLHELNKGIGLAAHGVGVGSYVYLRRVFESLVEEAHAIAINDSGWNEEEYQRSRMKEKIQLLAHHLPEFLVKHPVLYGILSKGVHELTEEECLADFDKLKSAIFVIAEEKLSELKRKKRIEEASKFLFS